MFQRPLICIALANVVFLSACQSLPLPSLRRTAAVPPPAKIASVEALPRSPALPIQAQAIAADIKAAPAPAKSADLTASTHNEYAVRPASYNPPNGPGTLPDTAYTGDPALHERYYSGGPPPGNYSNYCAPGSAQHGHGCAGGNCSGGACGGHAHAPAAGGGCPCCGGGNYGKFRFSDEVLHLPWKPPGIAGPWPQDEYVCDGGDLNADVRVKKDWTVVGLDKEDTIAHWDTLDGKTEVASSNPVCIYAPRFAAVRKVTSPLIHEGHERIAGVENPTKLGLHEETRIAANVHQPEQVLADVALDGGVTFREQTRGIGLDNVLMPLLARDQFMPHEDLQMIQRGVFQADEKARLAERTQAAVTWTGDQAVQIVIDGEMAVEGKGLSSTQETVVYELEGKPRLRICKIASTSDAKVGEFVDFTLRFDNVGDQKIGNVTIVDHLTTRLEYVEGSQQTTVKSNFVVTPTIDSTILRWEICEPLKVNEGGLIRFRAKVR
jgi:uncharacterized repeat protein (TIGR01451 family)